MKSGKHSYTIGRRLPQRTKDAIANPGAGGGFTVVGSATNGCQALRYASTLAPELVLMGLHLSKLSGAQATSQISGRRIRRWSSWWARTTVPVSQAASEAAGADAFLTNSPRT